MGLDMYLHARCYVGTPSKKDLSLNIESMFPELRDIPSHWGVGEPKLREVVFDVGYWRKANAIHRWFVENCQKGVDDCGTYDVHRIQLATLKETCERVLGFRHLAETQLPTQSGFFFGGTDYDDGYYHDVENTLEIVTRCLELSPEWEFSYHSSW